MTSIIFKFFNFTKVYNNIKIVDNKFDLQLLIDNRLSKVRYSIKNNNICIENSDLGFGRRMLKYSNYILLNMLNKPHIVTYKNININKSTIILTKNNYRLQWENSTLINGIEGKFLYIFKFNNEIYYVNNSRINDYRTINEYYKYKGSSINILFPEDEKTYNYAYLFIVPISNYFENNNVVQFVKHVRLNNVNGYDNRYIIPKLKTNNNCNFHYILKNNEIYKIQNTKYTLYKKIFGKFNNLYDIELIIEKFCSPNTTVVTFLKYFKEFKPDMKNIDYSSLPRGHPNNIIYENRKRIILDSVKKIIHPDKINILKYY